MRFGGVMKIVGGYLIGRNGYNNVGDVLIMLFRML